MLRSVNGIVFDATGAFSFGSSFLTGSAATLAGLSCQLRCPGSLSTFAAKNGFAFAAAGCVLVCGCGCFNDPTSLWGWSRWPRFDLGCGCGCTNPLLGLISRYRHCVAVKHRPHAICRLRLRRRWFPRCSIVIFREQTFFALWSLTAPHRDVAPKYLAISLQSSTATTTHT